MQRTRLLWGIIALATLLVLAACSATETASDNQPATNSVAKSEPQSEPQTSPPTQAAGENETSTGQTQPTAPEAERQEEVVVVTAASDAVSEHDAPLTQAEAQTDQAGAAEASPVEAETAVADRPAWQTVELTDTRTGETFSLASFEGQVVIMEAMAVWCPFCDQQQAQIKSALGQLGEGVVAISVDIDPGETADIVSAHADKLGLPWRFVLAGPDLPVQLQNEFGPQILAPPSTPVVIIGPDGSAQLTPAGIKSAATLVQFVQPLLPSK